MIVNLGEINLGQAKATNSLSLKMSYDFATHERPLGKPTRQKLGGKLDEWRVSFTLNFHFCDPLSVLQTMQVACISGEPKQLVFDYFDYQGWVTLDDVDITFVQNSDSGRPLIISGTLTLTEFTGDSTLKPPAPAVRDDSQSKPVQTANTDDVETLLPHRQPMQHLMDTLIAQHKARAMIRSIDKAIDGEISSINDILKSINDYFTENWGSDIVPPLPIMSDAADANIVLSQMDNQHIFYVELARHTLARL